MMAIPEYKVVLGRKKHRNEQEVQALLRAVGQGHAPPIRSLILELDSVRGISSLHKLLQSLSLRSLENFTLILEYCTRAEGLRVLASAIEAEKLPSLRKLQIRYRECPETQLRAQELARGRSKAAIKSSEEDNSSSSFSLLSVLASSASSSASVASFISSSLLSSDTSGAESSQSRATAREEASWEGFALLAKVLKEGLLQRLEAPVILDGNWNSRGLGDEGSRSFSEMVGTGFFSGLKELQLEDNSIGSEGMAAIASALYEARLLSLETLNLSHNCFAPVEGLLKILHAVETNHLPALKKLQLVGAGSQTTSNLASNSSDESDVSVADELVGIFSRNSGLTAEVEIDWPSRTLHSRWKKVWQRNAKLIKQRVHISAEAPNDERRKRSCICFQRSRISVLSRGIQVLGIA